MMMLPRASSPLLAALLVLAAVFGVAASAAAADQPPRVLQLDGSRVTSGPARGSALAGADATPRATTARRTAAATSKRPVATAARAAKPKKKPKKPKFAASVIRKAINATGAPTTDRLAARAALTSLDRIRVASPKSSQAKRESEGVLTIATTMARGNRITTARLPLLTETLRRNAEWWKLRRSTGSGQRVTFGGSQMVWQLYPGSGLQLQWLGTFGQGNFLYGSGSKSVPALTQLLDEALKYAVPRAGGIAWEYMFPFGGGSPPWVSGMAQATGIQVLSRAATKLARPDYLTAATSALGILKTDPPQGVRVVDATGTHFLIYSFAPGQKVLNAMNQTVNGLYAYVLANPNDVDGRLLLLDGLRWLDANVSKYISGNWTLYSLGGGKATRHYHELAAGFLKTTCSLLNRDALTAGGGPTGAYPGANICAYSARFAKITKTGSP